ncbi:M20/M25/M40 family metallo-hydrolase [Falsiroseomonas oryziterrae]|uniref:M20/M25/M40 family metallo-hydrolase n=1 Tax=Falsiroseomonas oryziterrae TaxID=2911368 RepID=UPI001F213F48|nr:M20/M25/M40 family metallo-hydrolase [Roseomonas sp. NPKOSM-4]
MSSAADLVDVPYAVDMLVRFLAIDSVTGEEAAIAAAVTDELKKAGVPASAIRHDTVHQRIPVPTQVGNLIVDLPGTRPGPRLLFSTHLDTVPLCRGAKPRIEGDRIVSDGTTALGGDNGTGCAVLVALARTLLQHNLPHPPITLLFTVREESGLHGARELDAKDLGGAVMGFNVDSTHAALLTVGAVGQTNWEVEVTGKAAHAGAAPEKGISATLVASLALAEAHRGGWFGKVVQKDGEGSSNAGVFGGKDGKAAGDATNVVTDYVRILGEARSLDAAFAARIADAYRAAFDKAQAEITDEAGDRAKVSFTAKTAYPPFELASDSPAIAHAKRAAASLGLEPKVVLSKGGLDANWLAGQHGVPTVTFGAGQAEIHTVKEYVDIPEFGRGCRMAVAIATLEA